MVKTPNVFLEATRRSVHNPPQLVLCAALGTVSLGKSCKMLPRNNEKARKCNLVSLKEQNLHRLGMSGLQWFLG